MGCLDLITIISLAGQAAFGLTLKQGKFVSIKSAH
jgi:hypothetical protein